jgi:hypothetical protein
MGTARHTSQATMSIDGNSTTIIPSRNSCVIDCSIATMDIRIQIAKTVYDEPWPHRGAMFKIF